MIDRLRDVRVQLGLIVMAGFGIRVWAVLAWQRHLPVEGDQLFYHHQARALADGAGFVNPLVWNETGDRVASALHPPLYSAYLGLVSVVGLDGPSAHKLASAVLGAVTVLLIGLVARRIGGDRAGLVAAGLAAVYPNLWLNDVSLAAESLYALFVAAILLVSIRLWDSPDLGRAAWLGAMIALAALTRAEALVLFGFLALPLILLLREVTRRDKVRLLGVTLVVGGAILAPWVIRNMVTFEGPSLVSNGTGFVVEISNCDETYAGPHLGYWDLACDTTSLFDDPNEAARHETEVERAKRATGIGYMTDHLDRVPVVMAARVGRIWEVYQPTQNVELNTFFERRGRLPSSTGLLMYVAMLPFGLWGLVELRKRRVTLVPFVALALSATLTAAISIGITRYRVGVDVALPVLAGVGVVLGWERLRPGVRFWWALASASWLALVVRFGNVLVLRPIRQSPDCLSVKDDCFVVNGDALYGHLQGELMAKGHGFASSASYWVFGDIGPGAGDPPMYPMFLGLVSSLHGTGGLAAFVVGLVVLVALVVLGWYAVRRYRGDAAGRVALLIGGAFALAILLVSILPQANGGPSPILDDSAAVAHRLASGLAGVAGVALIGLVGRRIGGARVGVLAALLAAFYPMLWINDGMLLSESLYVPAVACVMLASYWLYDKPTLARSAVLGLTIGFAALTRAEAALLAVVLVLPLLWAKRRDLGLRRWVETMGVAAVVAGALLLPWMAFNTLRFEEPTLMTSGTGAVLSAGSCDEAYHGDFVGYYGANCYQQFVDEGTAAWPEPQGKDESQLDAPSRVAGTRYIRENLDDLPRVMAFRVGRMWDLYRPGQNTQLNYNIEGRGEVASIAALWMYALMLPLALIGLVILKRRGTPISPLVSMAVVVTLTAALTFGVTRYRVPADVALVLAAAVTLDAILSRWPAESHDVGGHDDR